MHCRRLMSAGLMGRVGKKKTLLRFEVGQDAQTVGFRWLEPTGCWFKSHPLILYSGSDMLMQTAFHKGELV